MPVGSGSGTEYLTQAQAQTRILALWEPGAVVYELPNGLLVVLPAPLPRRVRAENSVGTPLVRIENNLLAAAPIALSDARRLHTQVGGSANDDMVFLVRGGQWEPLLLTQAQAVDPAVWLDLGAVTVVSHAVSLGAPPAPVVDALPAAAFDPRAAYGSIGVAPAPSERAAFVAALRNLKDGKENGASTSSAAAGVGTLLGGGLAGLASLLRARMQPPVFGRDAKGGIRSSNKNQGAGPTPSPADPPADPFAWLKWGAARIAGLTGLSGLIGRKQADYIKNMLDLFEKGDLEQALRHAIPLGSELDGLFKRLPPSLSAPAPRADLTIHPQQNAATTSLGTSTDLLGHFRAVYRQAFERLERAGRLDEAAFVLAELLQQSEEAVSFLEKHNRLALAADMAEARHLPPGLVVRLRFLSGDRARAIAFARATGAWADAVTRLERTPDRASEARVLRLEWAASLAQAGAYAQAVEVALPVEEAHTLVREWMGRVVESGGVPGARMRARRLALFPASGGVNETVEALALLAGEDEKEARARRAFIEIITRPDTWKGADASPIQRVLARAAVRTLARDTSGGAMPPPPDALYNALLKTASDPVLLADARPLRDVAGSAPAIMRHRALLDRSPNDPPFAISEQDTGLIPVLDAVHLPSGRTLVALGEMGVRLLGPNGQTIRDWASVPAHRLIPTDSGTLALALARRGGLWRLTRLDLVTGAVAPWVEAEIPVFAPDSDGSLWMVALPNGGETHALTALDLQGPPDRLASLWRTPLEQGRFVAINRSPSSCCALSLYTEETAEKQTEWNWQRWILEMPSLIMRDRFLWDTSAPNGPPRETDKAARPSSFPRPTRTTWQGAVNAEGVVALQEMETGGGQTQTRLKLWRGRKQEGVNHQSDLPVLTPSPPVLHDNWIAEIRYPDGSGPPTVVLMASVPGPESSDPARLRITLAGSGKVGARLFAGHLTVWDDRGRLLAFDLETGDVRADVRVR